MLIDRSTIESRFEKQYDKRNRFLAFAIDTIKPLSLSRGIVYAQRELLLLSIGDRD